MSTKHKEHGLVREEVQGMTPWVTALADTNPNNTTEGKGFEQLNIHADLLSDTSKTFISVSMLLNNIIGHVTIQHQKKLTCYCNWSKDNKRDGVNNRKI